MNIMSTCCIVPVPGCQSLTLTTFEIQVSSFPTFHFLIMDPRHSRSDFKPWHRLKQSGEKYNHSTLTSKCTELSATTMDSHIWIYSSLENIGCKWNANQCAVALPRSFCQCKQSSCREDTEGDKGSSWWR